MAQVHAAPPTDLRGQRFAPALDGPPSVWAPTLQPEHEHPSPADPTQPWRDRVLHADRLVGRSDALAGLLRQIHQASCVDIDVLLSGPTGAGKTLVAEVISKNGARADRPFVALNCANIPEALLESELFGAEKGAHSTATRAVEGKIAAADGGTLFLDEIVELPLAAQAKLLQFLQSRTYYPLGATRPREADVRIIAAANVALADAVAARRFRADLMYRINVFAVDVPSLAERVDDVPVLARAACAAFVEAKQLGPLRLGHAALTALAVAPWPGNVRELVHKVEAGAVRAYGDGATTILPMHLFPERGPQGAGASTWHEATRRFQLGLLRRALEEHDWNVREAARSLQLARSQVYKLIARHGLRR